MDFCSITNEDIKIMLKEIGVNKIDDLFCEIPEDIKDKELRLENGLSELECIEKLKSISNKNRALINFAGGGIYDHYIPAVVDKLSARAEFYTAYTPYQPECSQGTLQAIFEYQTAICNLTNMDVSNASLYDGGTALSEAILMSLRITEKSKVIICGNINPFYKDIIKTYLNARKINYIETNYNPDNNNIERIKDLIDENTSCVVFQNPDFFGSFYDYTDFNKYLRDKNIISIVSVNPISLGIFKTPGEMGFDICTGEGQALGNPMAFGGPSFGFIATKKEFIRNLPGRIVGETIDKNRKRAFVLTLQAREQHIKRHKATSNICSNQALCALRSIIFLSAYGKKGFENLALKNYSNKEYFKNKVNELKNIKILNKDNITFNEITISLPIPAKKFLKIANENNILAGIPLSLFYKECQNDIVVAITEKRTYEDIEKYINLLRRI